MDNNQRCIIIKIGTNVLTKDDGLLDTQIIAHLVSQIITAKKEGYQIILVSSGAMGAGRAIMGTPSHASDIVQRQMLAAVGQVRLMRVYADLLEGHGALCAQVLATKEDFRDRIHYLNMRNCFDALLTDKILPIVNENDVVSVSELMFTDNDELAGLIASMMNAEALMILSNVDGVYDRPPQDAGAKVIHHISAEDAEWKRGVSRQKSSFGRGGMITKTTMARRIAGMGIQVHIANGKTPNIICDILQGKPVGTTFVPSKKVSGIKKRIAYAAGQEKGAVIINAGAHERLAAKHAVASLLPVGIIAMRGEFRKGDMVKIEIENGTSIGIGVAQYGSDTLSQYIGKRGSPAFIHYDYLYMSSESKIV